MKALHTALGLLLCLSVGLPLQSRPQSASVVPWDQLVRQPTRHVGQSLRVIGQFQAAIPEWNCYLTRFTPSSHEAWQLWTDEQFLWLREEYEAPKMRVFTRSGSPQSEQLRALGPQARVELELLVRECFLELPWAEVQRVRVLEEFVGEGTAFHAARGMNCAASGSYQLALSEFDQALVAGLPSHARAALESLRAQAAELAKAPR